MKIENVAVLRATLEGMETPQLDNMLLEELRKSSPNGELIRLISNVLKARDLDVVPEVDDNIQQAWIRYQSKEIPVHKKSKRASNWLVKAAVVILVLFAVAVAIPQEAKAMNLFERFMAWTEDVFSLISPSEPKSRAAEYVFRTDNPGLQEVYDKVTELGVTVPVVPMWLPEGYELVECEVDNTPMKKYLSARFFNGNTAVIYQLNVYSDNVSKKYYIDERQIRIEEKDGIKHSIINNQKLLVAVWTRDNVECTISIDCHEDILNRVLESIYTMEDN